MVAYTLKYTDHAPDLLDLKPICSFMPSKDKQQNMLSTVIEEKNRGSWLLLLHLTALLLTSAYAQKRKDKKKNTTFCVVRNNSTYHILCNKMFKYPWHFHVLFKAFFFLIKFSSLRPWLHFAGFMYFKNPSFLHSALFIKKAADKLSF